MNRLMKVTFVAGAVLMTGCHLDWQESGGRVKRMALDTAFSFF
jgi:hypothetical protein